LILPGNVDLEQFEKGITVLRQAFKARDRAFAIERSVRGQRRDLHQHLIGRAVQYRSVILGLFPEDSIPVQTMPYLWPKQDRRKKSVELAADESQIRGIIEGIESHAGTQVLC
jgi:hypothetical protein